MKNITGYPENLVDNVMGKKKLLNRSSRISVLKLRIKPNKFFKIIRDSKNKTESEMSRRTIL